MNEKYKELLYSIDDYFEKESLIISFGNGLKVKCNSITGIYETDTKPGDDDCIEISLKCIPEKVSLESGTVLWVNGN